MEANAESEPESCPGSGTIQNFVATLRDIRRVSLYTVRNYQQALRDFCLWAEKNGGFTGDFGKISRRLMRDFIIEKQHSHSRATLHNHLAALRSLYRHLQRNGVVDASPLTGLRSPKLPKRLPRFLTERQMADLLAAPEKLHRADRLDGWTRTRDEAMLEFLYGAGLRVSELCGLNYASIDFSSGLVRVLGKGRKERLVPIGAAALASARRLRAATPRSNRDEDAVFTTGRESIERLYPRAVQLRLKLYLAAAELPPDLTPHKLRHTCATHMLDHDADLRVIQEQLGHASLSTTQIYTHVSLARLKRTYALAHPRA
jgi:integrase/recombinase XerC